MDSVCMVQPAYLKGNQEQRPNIIVHLRQICEMPFRRTFDGRICSVESPVHIGLLRPPPDQLNEKHRRIALSNVFPHALRQLIAFWISEYQITRLREFGTLMMS
jgi:hypothetical protein